MPVWAIILVILVILTGIGVTVYVLIKNSQKNLADAQANEARQLADAAQWQAGNTAAANAKATYAAQDGGFLGTVGGILKDVSPFLPLLAL